MEMMGWITCREGIGQNVTDIHLAGQYTNGWAMKSVCRKMRESFKEA
jgi:hypothetical protein